MTASNMPASSASGSWAVESQVEDTVVDASGRVVRGIRVGFVTGHGVHGSVFVPVETYSADVVKAKIAAVAADLDAVSTLTHDS